MKKKWISISIIVLSIIILIIVPNIKREVTPLGIVNAAKGITESVNKRDEAGFLEYIDQSNSEFYTEEKHLFQDILLNNIRDFAMEAEGAQLVSNEEYMVRVKQSYRQGDEKTTINYSAIFKNNGERFQFSDLYFKSIETEHFTVKYQPGLEKAANRLVTFIEAVYGNVEGIYGKAPEDKTIIKMYDDNKVFNAFIKPSIKFNMAGWYEYPESIKLNLSSRLSRILPEAAYKEHYFAVLSHELTHRINSMESNNNIPYWLAEGIATYVENKGKPSMEKRGRTIEKLETINLEELTDAGEIDSYYRDSYINTSLIIEKYGINGLHSMLDELGKYPLEEKTQGVIYLESNKRFHEVIKKLYGFSLKNLDTELE